MKTIILVLNENNEVYFENKKVKINPQASKNDPVVDLDSLKLNELAQFQRYVSLSRLKLGENEIELKDRKQVATLQLTEEEKQQIAELEAQIEAIKANARKRAPQKPKAIEDLSLEELQAEIARRKQLDAEYKAQLNKKQA